MFGGNDGLKTATSILYNSSIPNNNITCAPPCPGCPIDTPSSVLQTNHFPFFLLPPFFRPLFSPPFSPPFFSLFPAKTHRTIILHFPVPPPNKNTTHRCMDAMVVSIPKLPELAFPTHASMDGRNSSPPSKDTLPRRSFRHR